MATKVQSKATTTTMSKAEAEIKVVAVPKVVQESLNQSAEHQYAAVLAATTSEQTIVKTGKLVGKEMGKNDRDVTRASIKPLLEGAYKRVNAKLPPARQKEEKALLLYIGQQLSRILSIAYPGGADAKPEERAKATANMEKALAANLPVQKVYGMASGTLGFDKKGEIVEVKKSSRGGGNAKKPYDAYKDALGTLTTAAKAAKLTAEQLLTAFGDCLVDAEMIEDASELRNMLE